MVPAYYDIDHALRSDDDIADLKQVPYHLRLKFPFSIAHLKFGMPVCVQNVARQAVASCAQYCNLTVLGNCFNSIQVSVDVPRTAPDVPFFQQDEMQATLRRLLYIWGVRHPASGYVQGVNDLVTPFLAVFLSEHFDTHDMSAWQASRLSAEQLVAAEADSYWCLCKLVERCGSFGP